VRLTLVSRLFPRPESEDALRSADHCGEAAFRQIAQSDEADEDDPKASAAPLA